MWFVYIIGSLQKRWYYVGSTNRLKERLREHNLGLVLSTKHNKPYKIVFTKKFTKEAEARACEHKLKKCRIEKERIIKEVENNLGIACLRRQV